METKPGKSSLASRKPMLQVQRKERDSGFFTWTPWWLRSPFHLHELPHAPHRPSLMLGWLSFWQITAIFMAWYPHIYGIKKKKKNRRLKYQPFISVTSSHPLSFLPAQPLVRQHLTVARKPGTQGADISAWSRGNPWDEKAEQRCKVALGAMSTTWIPLEVKAATIWAL